MGEVYLATDSQLDRQVALKILPPELSADRERLSRFMREARMASAVNHPNAAHIYDLGESGGIHYITLEYVQGVTLDSRIGSLTVEQTLKLAIEVVSALAAAHARHVIHRDIKPANVMVTDDGRAKLLDFGLAKLGSEDKASASSETLHMTHAGVVFGTLPYMSPEQALGRRVDQRTDIFSFGVLLYELLAARRPFEGATSGALIDSILHHEPAPPSSHNHLVPQELDEIVGRCLGKHPDSRYPTAADLLEALRSRSGPAPSVTPSEGRSARPTGRSVAVLPFADLSPERDQQYFCDGVTEEISLGISKVPELRVASRSTTFAHRDVDVRELGRHLGVDTILEGSVRKSGNRLRVAVRLTNSADGFQLWSERYDGDLDDIFAVQEEIAASVAAALELRLENSVREELAGNAPRDIRAYEYYLRGRDLFYRHTRPAYEGAIEMYRRAISEDPHYARAWAALGQCWTRLYNYYGKDPASLREADSATAKALELAPQLAEAHVARAVVLELEFGFAAAEEVFQRALALDPTHFEACSFFADALRREGRSSEAAELYIQANRLRPDDYASLGLAANLYDEMQRHDDARQLRKRVVQLIERHLRIAPDDAKAMIMQGNTLIMLDEREKGIDYIARGAALAPNEPLVLYNVACGFALLGEDERALSYLDQAVKAGFGDRQMLLRDSDFQKLRQDPRFIAIADAVTPSGANWANTEVRPAADRPREH